MIARQSITQRLRKRLSGGIVIEVCKNGIRHLVHLIHNLVRENIEVKCELLEMRVSRYPQAQYKEIWFLTLISHINEETLSRVPFESIAKSISGLRPSK